MFRRFCMFVALVFLLGVAGGVLVRHGGAEPSMRVEGAAPPAPPVIRPSFAGTFYPADGKALRREISGYLKSANVPEIEGEIVALIVPHAGYMYSGPVAAYAYEALRRQVSGKNDTQRLDAAVVLGFSHRVRYPLVSVYYAGAMETPLGKALVNERLSLELLNSSPNVSFSEKVFSGEHSLEAQLPFIQTVLPDTQVVPILFGSQNFQNVQAVVDGLLKLAHKSRIVLIATTDLSHYKPYEEATELDKETLQRILSGDPRRLAQFLSEHYDRMCGPAPVLAAISFAESQQAEPVLLKYANSGDTAGTKDGVVGYAAVAFVKRDSQKDAGDAPGYVAPDFDMSDYLTDEDKRTLLRLARQSLESFVREKRILTVEPPASPRLQQDGASFVTFKKGGQLRGCIGQMNATTPLYRSVIDMAVAAASQDHRFPPVREEELDDIHIEVSVNTPLRPVSGPDEIVLGKHGVVVTRGLRQGVFLPQVAAGTGWTKQEFLENLCVHKAGLEPDAYKKGAKLYVFSSIVFGEK